MSAADTSLVPDLMQLECDEVIQNWDSVDPYSGFGTLKAEASTRTMSPQGFPVSDQQLHMYDNDTPPNSPVMVDGPEKRNLLQTNTEYVSHLLQIWRESAEYIYNSAASTQVDLNEYEQSQQWSCLSASDGVSSSQSSDGSHSNSGGNDDISMEEGRCSPTKNFSPQESAVESSFRNISFIGSGSRSNSPQNVNNLGPYDLLRSVSPALLRSPSPIFPVHRLLRSPSPNWEELQASLSELTPQDILLLRNERFSTRSHSPASNSDQEVPDIDMDGQSFYSDIDDYGLSRGRNAQSCQDQVVPEFIEE